MPSPNIVLLLLLLLPSFVFVIANGVPSTTAGSIYGEVYIPGEPASTFSIPVLGDSELAYNVYDISESKEYFPLVIWSTNFEKDPWSKAALLSNESIDTFLRSNFALGNSHYLFIASSNQSDMTQLMKAIDSRSSILGIREKKKNRILYGNCTIAALQSANSIVNTLNQWPSYVNYIQLYYNENNSSSAINYNITRLDCYWPYCNAPSSLTSTYRLQDGGDGCTSIHARPDEYSSSFLVVSADSCSFEEAAVNGQNAGALGTLVMSREGDGTLTQINAGGGANLYSSYTTSISYDDGIELKAKLQESSMNISFNYELIQGYFLVIDGERNIQQIGAPLNAYMMLASWANQYEHFRVDLEKNLSKSSYLIPIIDERYMDTTSKTKRISTSAISNFGALAVDTTITCPGNFDGDCAQWDHTVTLTVSCAPDSDDDEVFSSTAQSSPISSTTLAAGSASAASDPASDSTSEHFVPPGLSPVESARRRLEVGGGRTELARYIVPFGRRVGRWLTDATQLMPLLTSSNCSSFTFDASAGASNWIITSNLRFSDWGKGDKAPQSLTPLFSIFEYFRTDYNVNRTLEVDVPSEAKTVQLEAIISTHGYDAYGCCEFLPTRHVFTINDIDFNVSFDEAGTPWGCSDKVSQGSEPNEYGTWWYGRGGWCDGMDIKPWVVDVTHAINFNTPDENIVDYQAFMYYNGTWMPPQSDSQTGYVILSSNLVYYSSSLTGDVTATTSSTSASTVAADDVNVWDETVIQEGARAISYLAISARQFSFGTFAVGIIAVLALVGVTALLTASPTHEEHQDARLSSIAAPSEQEYLLKGED